MEPTRAGNGEVRYLCWCRGDVACHGTTTVPFTVCDECARFRHQPLATGGLTPEDVMVDA